MNDTMAEKRARMACRIYLKLFGAGSTGGDLTADDAIGRSDMMINDLPIARDVVNSFLDQRLFDRVEGTPYFALPPDMRQHMATEVKPGLSLADRLQEMLTEADRGDAVPGDAFIQMEKECRMGR